MYLEIDITIKDNIKLGMIVDIIADKVKKTQEVTRGCVKRVVSNTDRKKGIKVELTNGVIGTLVGIPTKSSVEKERFKFYNIFFYQDKIYAIWEKKANKWLVLTRTNKLSGALEQTVLLFSSEEKAKEIIANTSLDNKSYMIRPIKRKKPIVQIFKDYEVDVFSIDATRKLSNKKLKELEEYFKSF